MATPEQWREVLSFEGLYEVSDAGTVRCLRVHPPSLVSVWLDRDGYPRVHLSKNGKQTNHSVHRLVATAFHGDKQNALHNEVAHLDGNRANPRATNLKWVSKVENRSHRKLHGTECGGENHPIAKLTNAEAAQIKASKGLVSAKALAARYGVGIRTIHDVLYERRYRHVQPAESVAARATSLELNRIWALDAQWDEAAQQLRKAVNTGEFAGFDQAMRKFREIHRETRAAQKAAGHKS